MKRIFAIEISETLYFEFTGNLSIKIKHIPKIIVDNIAKFEIEKSFFI